MSEESDKSDPEDFDLEEIEVEVEEAQHAPPELDEGFEIVMEIEREESWPPPRPRKKV